MIVCLDGQEKKAEIAQLLKNSFRTEGSGAENHFMIRADRSDALFCGLAGGSAAEGKRIALTQTEKMITDIGVSRIIRRLREERFYRDVFRFSLLSGIREEIMEAAEKSGMDAGEMGSSLLLFVMDAENGDYLTVQLGKGLIMGTDTDGGIRRIGPPDSGHSLLDPPGTVSPDALERLRIGFGNAAPYRRIVLTADSAERGRVPPREEIFHGDSFRRNLCRLPMSMVGNYIINSQFYHDIAIIIIDFVVFC